MSCSQHQCDGSGWIEVFSLHTHERGPAHAWVTKEWIDKEVADALWKQGLNHQKQKIYSGVKRCKCSPPVARPANL